MAADAKTSATDTLSGEVISNRYRVIEPIARGGMGRIYKAEQIELGRLVALKILDGVNEDPEAFRKRFTLEAATSARLSHPNIVVVHDYGSFEIGGARHYYMAMELLDGQTLAAVMALEGRLEVGRAAWIAREIARALREAHRQGVVHRDLKPGNVMIADRVDGEHVKVLDFGIAKVHKNDAAEPITGDGAFIGTPRYMSPEQLAAGDIDARSDIFSVGVLLYQMLSGRVPHADKDLVQAMLAHVIEEPPELPDQVRDEVPESIRTILRTCMQYARDQRYPDAGALLAALDEAAAGLPGWSRTSMTGSAETPISNATGRGRIKASGAHDDVPTETGPRPKSTITTPITTALPSAPEMASPSSATRAAPSPVPSRAPWLVAAVIVVGALALYFARGRGTEPAGTEVSAPTTSLAAAPPPTSVAVTPPPEPTTFTLRVESEPTGAHMLRDGVEIGVTPMSLVLPRIGEPVTLQLVHDGFDPFVLTQPSSSTDVTVHAGLVAARTPRRPHGHGPTDPTPPPEDRLLKTTR